jgi:hypothetical protein
MEKLNYRIYDNETWEILANMTDGWALEKSEPPYFTKFHRMHPKISGGPGFPTGFSFELGTLGGLAEGSSIRLVLLVFGGGPVQEEQVCMISPKWQAPKSSTALHIAVYGAR